MGEGKGRGAMLTLQWDLSNRDRIKSEVIGEREREREREREERERETHTHRERERERERESWSENG